MAGERGSGSVLVAIWAVAVVFLACGGLLLAELQSSRAQVAAAADLSALAAAGAPGGSACQAAELAAHRNGAELEKCWTDGESTRVEVSAAPFPGRDLRIRARAHARVAQP